MDWETRQKWVEALRSGKYKQGSGKLRKDDCYCCLGVLCDISEGVTWQPNVSAFYGDVAVMSGFDAEVDSIGTYSNSGYLPNRLAESLGITDAGSFHVTFNLLRDVKDEVEANTLYFLIAHGGFQISLAALNDALIPFADIATIIEHAEFASA